MEQYGLEKVIEDLKAKGVKAGEEEAAALVAQAKEKADKILAEAKSDAERIRAEALAEKERTLTSMQAEMAQAARVGLAAFRQAIEKSMLVPTVDAALEAVITKPTFLESAVTEMVRAFAKTGLQESDLALILPAAQQQELAGHFVNKLKEKGHKGVKVAFDDSFSFGFQIGPDKGGFRFDLTDEGFRELLVRFLSPRFRQAFFQEAGAPAAKAKKTQESQEKA